MFRNGSNGVEGRDPFTLLGVGACEYIPATAIVSSASASDPVSSSFISFNASSTASGDMSLVSSAMLCYSICRIVGKLVKEGSSRSGRCRDSQNKVLVQTIL